ncbi:hypothetical protein PM082_003047 [Marasmius tenuissimus]|nr:hypothetical protein PM082_003047 [Marasmius tenuissimus]
MHAIAQLIISVLFFIPLVLNNHLALAAPIGEISARHNFPRPQEASTVEASYSGPAGNSNGGDVSEVPSHRPDNALLGELSEVKLVKAFSGNGGKGGASNSVAGVVPLAKSSDRISGSRVANAYSGTGGTSKGGDVSGEQKGLIDAFSGNAGDGGSSSSGSKILS